MVPVAESMDNQAGFDSRDHVSFPVPPVALEVNETGLPMTPSPAWADIVRRLAKVTLNVADTDCGGTLWSCAVKVIE
jgi:hypothetical protein